MINHTVSTPADFDFENTILSHGWRQLAPFRYDTDDKGRPTLHRTHKLADGTLLTLTMRDTGARSILVNVQGRAILTSKQRNELSENVRTMFNLRWNLRDFYNAMKSHEEYKWVVDQNIGRMLASPTVWEDIVKTLMTTNISWEQTRTIIDKLCDIDPSGSFPTPQQIVALDEDELQGKIGAGYRTAHLYKLATRITEGDLNVEAWRALDSDELYKAVKTIDGLGDYAAGTVLRLLGHFDKLAIDSVARNAFERVTGNEPESDTDIRDYYESFGQWRGLVLWMDCIRDEFVSDDTADTDSDSETSDEAQKAAS